MEKRKKSRTDGRMNGWGERRHRTRDEAREGGKEGRKALGWKSERRRRWRDRSRWVSEDIKGSGKRAGWRRVGIDGAHAETKGRKEGKERSEGSWDLELASNGAVFKRFKFHLKSVKTRLGFNKWMERSELNTELDMDVQCLLVGLHEIVKMCHIQYNDCFKYSNNDITCDM